MTSGTATRRRAERQDALDEIRRQQQVAVRKRTLLGRGAWVVGLLVVGTLVTAALLSSQPVVDTQASPATPFTLPTSDGQTVSLSDFAGKPVILYFNEGAGCDSCLQQMTYIEQEPGFDEAGIAVLPIVMNTADQINADAVRLGVQSAFLLDDGTVSEAYGRSEERRGGKEC